LAVISRDSSEKYYNFIASNKKQSAWKEVDEEGSN
jgi:hypothetical protein